MPATTAEPIATTQPCPEGTVWIDERKVARLLVVVEGLLHGFEHPDVGFDAVRVQ